MSWSVCYATNLLPTLLQHQIKCVDDEIDMSKMKVLALFLDVSLNAQDPQAQRSIIDELADDLVTIFQTLVFWTKLCQLKLKQGAVHSSEEISFVNEIMSKSLAVVEMLSTVKGTKVHLRELITTSNPCIRFALPTTLSMLCTSL